MTEDEYGMADGVEFWTGLDERRGDAVRAMVGPAPWSEVEAAAAECGYEARFGDGGGA